MKLDQLKKERFTEEPRIQVAYDKQTAEYFDLVARYNKTMIKAKIIISGEVKELLELMDSDHERLEFIRSLDICLTCGKLMYGEKPCYGCAYDE